MLANKLIYTTGASMLAISLLIGCQREKFAPPVKENFELSDKAFVRLYNGAVGTARNFLYLNENPLTGAAVGYGGLFPATGGFYSAIPAGQLNLNVKDTITGAVQPVVPVAGTFDAGKRYTIFTYDTATQAKQLTIEDRVEVPADTSARVRFVNIPFSRNAIPNVDVYSKRRGANVFSNISLNSATDFIPYEAAQTDTLYVRETGTTTNLATMNTFAPARKRSYTIVFRGAYGASSGATARTLTNFLTY
ncbi:DUF4397 domain-containing protein [Flavihumibacter sp. RY-1]|uniref:DUF4397 domain-containing protein n=1 Tax=Flavihumibacter fluminis TaxID=2909236 RepID=A0ABS9BHP3_9BACT|nr:DUF4397 domain-containing protein [Flavihumibacter fluminis]MCF1715111.1 DUF4397 domain-containing protein [Flavihumibacter fluminis]